MSSLFQGAALYSAEEILNSCKVFAQVKLDCEAAVIAANNFANEEVQKLSVFGKVIESINSNLLSRKTIWWQRYTESYNQIYQKYDDDLIFACGQRGYSCDSEAVRQLKQLSTGSRECYLNPRQVKLVEKTRKHWAKNKKS